MSKLDRWWGTCTTLQLWQNMRQLHSIGERGLTLMFHSTHIRSHRLRSPTLAKNSNSDIARLCAACFRTTGRQACCLMKCSFKKSRTHWWNLGPLVSPQKSPSKCHSYGDFSSTHISVCLKRDVGPELQRLLEIARR